MTFSNHFLASPRWNFLGWLLPALAGGFLLYRELDKGLLQFDEADYVTAARRGFVANYLDAGAMPTREFVAKGARDVLLGEHSSLSKEMRERDDINFYRHYHAPLIFYLLAIAGNLFGTGEMVFRMVEWLTAVLIIVATYWSLRILCGEQGRWTGFLAALLAAVSPMIHNISASISVHALYAAIALMTVGAQARYLQTRNVRDFYIFIGFMALAFLTNEFAPFLLGSCLLGFLLVPNDILSLEPKRIVMSYHLFGGIALFLLVFFLLWPAGILKFSALKSYLFLAYFVFVKKEIAYGTQSVIQNWLSRLAADPMESMLVIFGAGFALYGFLSKKLSKALLPMLIYPLVIFGANILNKGSSDMYVLSMYSFLLSIAVLGIVHWSQQQASTTRRNGIVMGVIAIAAIGNITLERLAPREDLSPFQAAFTLLKSEARNDDRVLVSYGYLPTMNYYLPDFDIYTIYLEEAPEAIAAKFDQRFYRYFIFFGTEEELRAAAYRPALEINYRELRRVPNRQNKVLIIFKVVNGKS